MYTRPDFTNVQVGETVILYSHGIYPRGTVTTVDRVTATQFTVRMSAVKFRKRDGTQIGGHHQSVRMATPELVAELEHAERRRKLLALARNVNLNHWRNLSNEQIESALAIFGVNEGNDESEST